MAVILGQNNYGKSRVRLVKVSRDAVARHTVREISADIALQGDFTAIHCKGDNANCLPTDTMKNTVYALAKNHPIQSIEVFALDLAAHFLGNNPPVSSARVRLSETPWDRVELKGTGHPHCFTRGGEERATCDVTATRSGASVVAGIENLTILKSADSGFSGYHKDKYTTLAETDDRIFATSMSVQWTFAASVAARPEAIAFLKARSALRTALIETFASHKSRSVQHTLYAMAEAALAASDAIEKIHLSMPNKHCLLVNLAPFGLENKNEIFVPTDEPYGLIEATVSRG